MRLKTRLLKQGRVKVIPVGRSRREIERADRNRAAMIEKVRTIWITGFLQQSLFQEARILLGLERGRTPWRGHWTCWSSARTKGNALCHPAPRL